MSATRTFPVTKKWADKRWLKIGCTFLFLCTLFLPVSAAAKSAPKALPKPTNEDCLTCHGDSGLSTERNGKTVSLHVDADKFKASIHGTVFSCVDCHTDLKSSPHENTPAKVNCATCHADEQAMYDRSFHAKAIAAGDAKAATCTDCHGSPHELLPASDPKSRVSDLNIPQTCGTCHGQKFVMEASGPAMRPSSPTSKVFTDAPSLPDPKKPPSAPIATARTRFFPPATPNRPSSNSTFP